MQKYIRSIQLMLRLCVYVCVYACAHSPHDLSTLNISDRYSYRLYLMRCLYAEKEKKNTHTLRMLCRENVIT